MLRLAHEGRQARLRGVRCAHLIPAWDAPRIVDRKDWHAFRIITIPTRLTVEQPEAHRRAPLQSSPLEFA